MTNYTEKERAFGENCGACLNMIELFDHGKRWAECNQKRGTAINKGCGRCDEFAPCARVNV